MIIPFVPIPFERAVKLSRRLYPVSSTLEKSFPKLEEELYMAEMDVEQKEYIGVGLIAALSMTLTTGSILLLILSIRGMLTAKLLALSLLVSFAMAFLSFFYVMNYPKFKASARVRSIDSNLLFAMRHLLVRVRSGIPLFSAMEGIAKGGYGAVSKEFEILAKQVRSGRSELKALDDTAARNPSLYFRRVIWQVSNSIRAGTDLSRTLESIINSMAEEQKVTVKKYGAQLNPIALMYLMITVVAPSLGITVVIILGNFIGKAISKEMFYMIPLLLMAVQFFFMGIIKARRPSVEV